jgi:hypothetical protein
MLRERGTTRQRTSRGKLDVSVRLEKLRPVLRVKIGTELTPRALEPRVGNPFVPHLCKGSSATGGEDEEEERTHRTLVKPLQLRINASNPFIDELRTLRGLLAEVGAVGTCDVKET